MDRSRSKRHYYDQIEPLPRTKQRYIYSRDDHTNNYHHRRHDGRGAGGRNPQQHPSSLMVTTSYRILCHDANAGGVIGKSGSIIKAIREHTGAWINVHELMPGDEERIIEISDTRRRDPDGRMPSFSPAQEALLLVHERILESDAGGYTGWYGGGDEDDGPRGGLATNKVVARLVVSRMHVGCLIGKGGKIIEQMKMETKTHIRVLPRDQTLPYCVASSEEIVQVVGEIIPVKNAITIISSRLRESQHRDRGPIHGRQHSTDLQFPPIGDFMHHPTDMSRRPSLDGPNHGPRSPDILNNARTIDLVFRILCPNNKVDRLFRHPNGIVELLWNEIGVEVKVADLVVGSDEQIIMIISEEGPDDEFFPAQEALLHIQAQIVDLAPEKGNIITTRLLVSAGEIGCLEGRENFLSETKKMTGANIQILPREELPGFISVNDDLLQIVGDVKAARKALVEVTSRLRSYAFQDCFRKDTQPSPPLPAPSTSNSEAPSSNKSPPSRETHAGNDTTVASNQNLQATSATLPVKNTSGINCESAEDTPRVAVPLITRSIREVVIPQYAVPKLITKSRNKLAQISELSGATVKLVDDESEATDHMIRISGTHEQAERAQSLLQGFILSTEEDGP